jgi:Flp pilus assembly protein TadG
MSAPDLRAPRFPRAAIFFRALRRAAPPAPLEQVAAPARRPLLCRPMASLRKDERGVAAIEFAFIAPIMLAMLIGIVDVSNAVSINWRMVQLNKTLADLTSQSTSLTTAQLDNIFTASATVLSPYSGKLPRMEISSVVVGMDRKARVCWSEAREDGQPGMLLKTVAGLTKGTVVPLPNLEMAVPTYSYIVTTTKLDYDGYLTPDFQMNSKTLYFRPRAGNRDTNSEQVERIGQPTCAAT